tara:strand:+ start:132 stop:401 length:270 start_codon:yes stop_codon:yes gene_type:complete
MKDIYGAEATDVKFVTLVFGYGEVGGFWAEIVKECTKEDIENDCDVSLFYTNSDGQFYQAADEAVEAARAWAEKNGLIVVEQIKWDKEI